MKAILKTIFYTVLTMPFVSWADVANPTMYIADEYIPRPAVDLAPVDLDYHVFVYLALAIIEILLIFLLIIVCKIAKSKLFADKADAEDNTDQPKVEKCKSKKVLSWASRAAAWTIFVILTFCVMFLGASLVMAAMMYFIPPNKSQKISKFYLRLDKPCHSESADHNWEDVPGKSYQQCKICRLKMIPGSRGRKTRPGQVDMDGFGNAE